MPVYQTLVIGDGFAGCLLAWRLWRQGRQVCLLGAGEAGAWSVAAGLAAPVTGQRATLQPNAIEQLAHADALYKELEAELGLSFWRQLKLLHLERPGVGSERWLRRCDEVKFKAYLREATKAELQNIRGLRHPITGVWIAPAYHLDLQVLVPALRRHLDQAGVRHQTKAALERLVLNDATVQVDGFTARRAVLAQGAEGRADLLNAPVRLAPTRGEILELNLAGWPIDLAIHGDPFLLPLTDGTVLCGATYDRVDLSLRVSDHGRQSLAQGLDALVDLPYQIVGHRVGLRPTTTGHQAFARQHPQHASLTLLNGLGSKAVLAAPALTQALLQDLSRP